VSGLDRSSAGAPARYRRDRAGGKIFGVCAGLGHYMNVDPWIVRGIFLAGTIFGFGSFILIYLLIALLAD
jgi:phage shock protein PspC (stress-responsive transcriptional regulator)